MIVSSAFMFIIDIVVRIFRVWQDQFMATAL